MRQKAKNPKRCVAYDFQYPGDGIIAKKRSRTLLEEEEEEDKEERAGKNEDGCDQDENELERGRKLSKMGAQMLLLSSSVLEEEKAGAVPSSSSSSDGDVEDDDVNKLSREEEEPPPRLKPKEEERGQNNNDADNNDNNIDDTNNTEIKLMIALQRSILLACTELPDAQAATAEARNAFLQMPLMNSLALALGSDAKSSFQGVSMDKITNHDVLQCVFVAAGECKADKKRVKRNNKKDAHELVNLPTRYVGPHVGEKCCRSCWHRIYRITNTLSLPFSCDICAETFKKEHLLTAHVRVEHEGKQAYLCPVPKCGKEFSRRTDLKKHGLVHTGERPYACAYCDQRFISSSNLNKHERQHTGFKPYSCRVCLKKFSRSIGLRNHVQQQHLKDTSWSSSKVAVVEEEGKEEVETAIIRKKGKKNWGDKTTAYTAPMYVLRPPGETTNLNKNINKKAPLSESENSLELYLNQLAEEKETKKYENHFNDDDDESSS